MLDVIMRVSDFHDSRAEPPRPLIVFGASAGMGRWFLDAVLKTGPWSELLLVDAENAPRVPLATSRAHVTVRQCFTQSSPQGLRVVDHTSSLEVVEIDPRSNVVVAVPLHVVSSVCDWLRSAMNDWPEVVMIGQGAGQSFSALGPSFPQERCLFVRPLFDGNAEGMEGNSIVAVFPPASPERHEHWFTRLVQDAGGVVRSDDHTHHDAVMEVVDGLTFEALWASAAVLAGSDFRPEELWESRTPRFEALLALVVSSLSDSSIRGRAGSLSSGSKGNVRPGLLHAAQQIAELERTSGDGRLVRAVKAFREQYSGAFFAALSAMADDYSTTTRSKVAALADSRRDGTLIGLRQRSEPTAVKVGRVIELTSLETVLEELLMGEPGDAVLQVGIGAVNARRVGRYRKPHRTRLSLGGFDVLSPAELEVVLQSSLKSIVRDVRFLVSDSVGGEGVLAVVRSHPAVTSCHIRDDVVRTGQRAVLVSIGIRVDHDIGYTIEELRDQVQQVHAWPRGVCRPAYSHVSILHYLGPQGTFSEVAARQCAEASGVRDGRLIAHDTFDALLSELGRNSLAVLPISSSSSGLVSRGVDAVLRMRGEVELGGITDVAVRFDAYIPSTLHLDDMRGADVLSHPQALAQCARFIKRFDLHPRPTNSTRAALDEVRQSNSPCVALAGPGFGTQEGLRIAEREVDDLSGSITRFLLLGLPGSFDRLPSGHEPTLRSIWIGHSLARSFRSALDFEAVGAFDEILSDSSGRFLWVSSSERTLIGAQDTVALGRVPWSPRTPMVRPYGS